MTLRAGGLADVADLTPGVGIGIPKFIFKGTAENLASNITFQDDDVLFFTMEPGVRYFYDFNLNVQGPVAGDFKTQFTAPIDVAGVKMRMGPCIPTSAGWVARDDTNGAFASHGVTTATSYAIDTSGSAIREYGWVESATGGTLRLQWAQVTSNATNTTVNSSSFLMYMRAQ